MSKNQNLIFLGICFFIVFAIYGQTIFGDFVFDDRMLLDYKDVLSDINQLPRTVALSYWAKEAGLYRPVTLVSYSFNYILLGSGALGFHLFNLVLYALSGFLIFLLVKKLFSNQFLAFLTAIIFLVLPIHTEVVANIIGRAEILALFFSLLFFLEILKEKINFWKVGAWALLALGSKETATVIFPIALIVVFLKEKSISVSVIKKYLAPALASFGGVLVYFLARFFVLGGKYFLHIDTTLVENPLKFVPIGPRIATAFKILTTVYLKKTLWPFNLCSDYSYNQIPAANNFLNPETISGIIILFLFFIGFFIFLKSKPYFSLGSALFVLGFLPISNILFPIGTIAGERLMYFPMLGFSLCMGGIFSLLIKKFSKKYLKMIIFTLIAGLLIFYTTVSTLRANVWLTEKKLFISAAKCAPNSVLSRSNLGAVYYLEGDLKRAKEELLLAYQIYDKYPKGLNNLGLIYWKEGKREEAREMFLRALEGPFPYYGAYENLALMALEEREFQEARNWLRRFFQGDSRTIERAIETYIESFNDSGKIK